MKNETQWHMFYQRLWEFFSLIPRLYLKTSPQRERGCPSSCVKVFVLAQTHKHWITCLNCSVFEGMMEDSGADSHPLFGSTRVETVVVVQQGMGLHLDEGEPGPGAVADKGRREMWPITVLSRDRKGRHGGLQETMKKMWFFFFYESLGNNNNNPRLNTEQFTSTWSKIACAVFHEDVALCVRMNRGGRIIVVIKRRSVEIRMSSG